MKNQKPSITAEEIYAEVNARIIAALEKGIAPWQKPWASGLNRPRNLQSGKSYRGINALLLSMSEFGDPRWTTFAAAKKMGGMVRKGERSTLVTLWKRIRIKDADAPNGVKVIPILRYFRVFNVEQVVWPEGVLMPYDTETRPDDWDADAEAEGVLAEYIDSPDAPTLAYGGGSAHYLPSRHHIQLPERETFKSAGGFYGVAFHEAAHSTGHKSMLNRADLGAGSYGSEPYGREELVAEMTAAMVSATVGVDGEFDNSVAYIKGWMQSIKNDPKMLVKAAGKAQEAADRILGITHDWATDDNAAAAEAVAA